MKNPTEEDRTHGLWRLCYAVKYKIIQAHILCGLQRDSHEGWEMLRASDEETECNREDSHKFKWRLEFCTVFVGCVGNVGLWFYSWGQGDDASRDDVTAESLCVWNFGRLSMSSWP